ncbi:DUF2063 domain-containing protein [Neisseria sp.]|uniref:HvfC family RiPP maturation protein n=1 Tax=Neisseria sp. TaxID=192066 RepID=UPI0035A03002
MQPDTPNSAARAQQAFADHVRNPSLPAPEGIAPERMAVYVRLVRNNLQNFLDRCFSDSSTFLDPARWQNWQHRFLDEARPESPFFNDIPAAFLAWLGSLPPEDRPSENILAMMAFETDLLHAETVIQPVSDGLWHDAAVLVPAPSVRLKHYSCDFVGSGLAGFDDTPSDVLVWRNRRDEVLYQAVSGIDLFLLQHFLSQPDSYDSLSAALSEINGNRSADAALRESIAQWSEAGVLVAEENG